MSSRLGLTGLLGVERSADGSFDYFMGKQNWVGGILLRLLGHAPSCQNRLSLSLVEGIKLYQYLLLLH